MITEREIQHHFIDRFVETHGEAPEGFVSAIYKRIERDTTLDHLEIAAEATIRNKRAKTFPSFAECLDAIKAAKDRPPTQERKPVISDVEKFDPRWSEEAALNFCRDPLGKQAARDGWIGQMVDFVRVQKRLPFAEEIRDLQKKHQVFLDCVVATMGTGFVSHWRPMGEAIMRRNARYEDEILGSRTYDQRSAA